MYLDAIVVKSRQDGRIRNKSVYLALGVNLDGHKELLGLWIANSERAKFWLNIITELKNRGVNDIVIASVDGLKGFPEAIQTVFLEARVQLCIVHMDRNSLKYVSWKDRKKVAADLKRILLRPRSVKPKYSLKDFVKSGMKNILPSASHGGGTGKMLFPFLIIRRIFAK